MLVCLCHVSILRLMWWREGRGEDLVGSHSFQGGTEGRSLVSNRSSNTPSRKEKQNKTKKFK